MDITTAAAPSANDALVCFQGEDRYRALPDALRAYLDERLERRVVVVAPTHKLIPQPLVVAVQRPEGEDAQLWRRRGGIVARALVGEWQEHAALALPEGLGEAAAHAFLLGIGQGAYAWDRYQEEELPRLATLRLLPPRPQGLARERILALHEAVDLCRDLINTPAEDLGPAEFVAAARTACRGSGLALRVMDEAECRRRRLGCLLAVGRASPRRPRLLVVDWRGGGGRDFLALCGKGICFDTGGLDIKTAQGMELMRKDMGGGATVLAAMRAIAAAKVRRRVRAYIPLADNAIDGSAFRPGDILRAADGTTVEIGNTDAEGRLVLADAICLARKDGAARIVTVATLTGAALIALGRVRVPLMGTDDALLAAIEGASAAVGERVWRLPFDDDYRGMVKGANARLANSTGPDAACITAGCFLAHFAGDVPFAHCDISPASWQPAPHDLGPAGATGILVATLVGLAGGREQGGGEKGRAKKGRRKVA